MSLGRTVKSQQGECDERSTQGADVGCGGVAGVDGELCGFLFAVAAVSWLRKRIAEAGDLLTQVQAEQIAREYADRVVRQMKPDMTHSWHTIDDVKAMREKSMQDVLNVADSEWVIT